jgi:phosphate acyltransferase
LVRIAVDAMGGDHSPQVVVDGVNMLEQSEGIEVLLVGDPEAIDKCAPDGLRAEVVKSTQVVEGHDSPSFALKKKPDSSIAVGVNLVKQGRADGFVSMGNTGAVMASALFTWDRLPGISRPALTIMVPTHKQPTLLIDVGACVDCKPMQLVQFAIMGSVYAEEALGRTNPRVGLLSIGTEASKGNELVAETRPIMEAAPINFIGNVEGNQLSSGEVDVAVCDGFVGNSLLKFGEGLVETIFGFLFQYAKEEEIELDDHVKSMLWKSMARMDYTETGGAQLLGLQGACLIGHGRSSSKAVCNAIRTMANTTLHHVNDRIVQSLQKLEEQTN